MDKGIFYSRKRGYFKYTLEFSYEDADENYPNYRPEEKLILDFGNIYVLIEFFETRRLWNMAFKEYSRWQKSSIQHALKTWRAVIVSGYAVPIAALWA